VCTFIWFFSCKWGIQALKEEAKKADYEMELGVLLVLNRDACAFPLSDVFQQIPSLSAAAAAAATATAALFTFPMQVDP